MDKAINKIFFIIDNSIGDVKLGINSNHQTIFYDILIFYWKYLSGLINFDEKNKRIKKLNMIITMSTVNLICV
jgi:hypothetical protein